MKYYVWAWGGGDATAIINRGIDCLMSIDHPKIKKYFTQGNNAAVFPLVGEVNRPDLILFTDIARTSLYSSAERTQLQVLKRLCLIRDDWSRK